MVKFKEYSKRFIFLFSACVCLLMTLFCPFDEFLANESVVSGATETITIDVDKALAGFYPQGSTAFTDVENFTFSSNGYNYNFIYFYQSVSDGPLMLTSSDVYAYKISCFVSDKVDFNFTCSKDYYPIRFGLFGDTNEGGDDYVVGSLESAAYSTWYVNDYNSSWLCYNWLPQFYYGTSENISTGAITTYSPSFNVNCTLTFYITPYSIDDTVDELYDELLNLVEGQEDLYNELVSIRESSENIETYVNQLQGCVHSIMLAMPNINNNIITINNTLLDIQSTLEKIYDEEQEQTSWLEKIWNSLQEFLGLTGDKEDVYDEPVDDSGFVDLDGKEDDLLGSSSPGDLSGDLSVELDPDSNSFIWSVITKFATIDGTVFGVFITVLTFGVVALILGR